MTLKVVGAGVGRTGTHSLKLALETLLGSPCYHMVEVFPRPEHWPLWHEAVLGGSPDWGVVFEGFSAVVDWPGAAAWRQIQAAYPEAVVLLSSRESSDAWWNSYSKTILASMQQGRPPEMAAWFAMATDMLKSFCPDFGDRDACIAAYEAHNAAVRAEVPADRLIDWTPADGWGPICDGLGLPEPSQPFPVTNSTSEFRAMSGLDEPAAQQADGAAAS
jgi:hypothetical protein